ncbi:hypothetical protein L2E82_45081 [Cichorium intybus]|uniref:Uncharacterized protein n=1 Tax=Cichorium intybus TaxID=13427 RepID=A0ACB8ZSC0_CICIN|nr:hypothetical protein L2E82_45081 [Cichorium intybus]
MFSKCGSINDARSSVFSIVNPNMHAWTAMVNGYVHHRLCFEANLLLEREVEEVIYEMPFEAEKRCIGSINEKMLVMVGHGSRIESEKNMVSVFTNLQSANREPNFRNQKSALEIVNPTSEVRTVKPTTSESRVPNNFKIQNVINHNCDSVNKNNFKIQKSDQSS